MQTRDVGAVRLWGMHGRAMSHDATPTDPVDFGLIDVDAKSFLNIAPQMSRVLGANETPGVAKPEQTLG